MWRRYFKLVKLVPGKVIVQGHGTLDFAGDVPVALCQQLFEEDFEFLEITEEGKRELYGMQGAKSEEQEEQSEAKAKVEEPETRNMKPETRNEQPVKTPKRRTKRKV